MDYPLGVELHLHFGHFTVGVLIPILMDYPLGGINYSAITRMQKVLIPILMDYPLGGTLTKKTLKLGTYCLNPYSNGLPSRGTQIFNLC